MASLRSPMIRVTQHRRLFGWKIFAKNKGEHRLVPVFFPRSCANLYRADFPFLGLFRRRIAVQVRGSFAPWRGGISWLTNPRRIFVLLPRMILRFQDIKYDETNRWVRVNHRFWAEVVARGMKAFHARN